MDHNKCLEDEVCSNNLHQSITYDFLVELERAGLTWRFTRQDGTVVSPDLNKIDQELVYLHCQWYEDNRYPGRKWLRDLAKKPYIIGLGGVPYYSNYFYVLVHVLGLPIPYYFYNKYITAEQNDTWVQYVGTLRKDQDII
uniref:Uncharacterized protein n=1 Tax=Marseillevirus LCMAC201 TaxID=2506605 RepID=A0A481YXL9_9VIRU|nr:MAG: hypothetical protein LCMAC201_01380 [Marseillevirus LCMAC201]